MLTFDWCKDRIGGGRLPLSARWMGLLRPTFNETYTLILSAAAASSTSSCATRSRSPAQQQGAEGGAEVGGGARVWLDGKVLLVSCTPSPPAPPVLLLHLLLQVYEALSY
jgi:hypothetical protein